MDQQIKGNNKNGIGRKKELTNYEPKMGDKKKYFHPSKLSIWRRGMPAELLNEIFACITLKNSFGLLTKMPNGILARNIRKMLKSIKMVMKTNKWNKEDCSTNLSLSENGLEVQHIGLIGTKIIRAQLSIPIFTLKPRMTFYFETQILNKGPLRSNNGIGIGFIYGPKNHSENFLGICHLAGLWVERRWNKFEISDEIFFQIGDLIGIGLVHSQANSALKCFVTCNGKLIGSIELPAKFNGMQFYPVLAFYHPGESIRTNFGTEQWRFNPDQID